MKIPQSLKTILEEFGNNGGVGFVVGGSVRDLILGKPGNDFDVEVFGLSEQTLKSLLAPKGDIETVGDSFAVYKVSLKDDEGKRFVVDFSLPRRERKTGEGHKGFTVEADPGMSFEEAARRRDFTINAMMYNPLTGELLDFFGGKKDVALGILRVVDSKTFVEDSLRVLRAIQFAARFGFTIEPETVKLCETISLGDLPAERIFGELVKLLLSEHPSVGFQYILDMKIFQRLWPFIKRYDACDDQIKIVLDSAVKVCKQYQLSKAKTLAVQFKLFAAAVDAEDTENFLDLLKVYTFEGYNLRKYVLSNVGLSFFESFVYGKPITDSYVFNLSAQTHLELYAVEGMALWTNGSETMAYLYNKYKDLYDKAAELGVLHNPPKPFVTGDDLISMGMVQGKELGKVLKRIYQDQLDCVVSSREQALNLVKLQMPVG